MAKLFVDLDKCLNSGQCAYLQPELFELNDNGEPHVLEQQPSGDLIAKANDAIAMCPAQAISLVDDHEN